MKQREECENKRTLIIDFKCFVISVSGSLFVDAVASALCLNRPDLSIDTNASSAEDRKRDALAIKKGGRHVEPSLDFSAAANI